MHHEDVIPNKYPLSLGCGQFPEFCIDSMQLRFWETIAMARETLVQIDSCLGNVLEG